MEYNNNQTIYRQITDYCIRQISGGEWKAGERIPSTRELSLKLGVNSRTIIRAYEELEAMGIIYTQRGFGSFTHADVMTRLRVLKQREFNQSGLDDFILLAKDCDYPLDFVIKAIEGRWNELSK